MEEQITDEELKLFRQFIMAETGIALHAADDFLVLNFLGDFMKERDLDEVAAVVDWLKSVEEEGFVQNWVASLFESPNGFFHDFRDFKFFRRSYVPWLMEERASQELRVGCIESGLGQEAYSLAIMINEAMPELVDWNVQIVATDTSESKVHRARQGVFTDREIQRGMPLGLIDKSFEKKEQSWQIRAKHRDRVSFQKSSIHGDFKRLPLCDIICLRGVLLYMDDSARQSLLEAVSKRLAPGGCLLIGRGEARLSGAQYRYFQNDYGCSAFFRRPKEETKTFKGAPPAVPNDYGAARKTFRADKLSDAEVSALTENLRALALLKGKTVGQIESLVNSLPIRKYKPGENLLNEAEPNDTLMGTVSGEVSIWLGTGMFGRPTKVTTLGPGHLLGEQSVVERADCTATVRAETEVTVFEMGQELFRRLMDENTHFATHIRNLMRSRLAQRSAFRETGIFPEKRTTQLKEDSESLGLNNEKRYVLKQSSLPRGATIVDFDDALVGDFMDFVRRASLLKGLSVDVLDTLARLICCVEFSQGTCFIQENEWPEAFYLIHEGEVSILVGAGYFSRGREITVLGPGDVAGEMSMILGQRANASVVATSPVRAFAISRELFDYLYNRNKNFQTYIDEIMESRQ